MTPKQFATILGLTETAGNPVAWGDEGQAMGRWQVHPAWLWDQTGGDLQKPRPRETWDSWVGRLVENFFASHVYLPPVEIAMYFHLGHRTLKGDSDWDTEYAKRFLNYAAKKEC